MRSDLLMSIFERILYLLQADMEPPASYGVWHICFLLLTAAASVLAVWRFRNASEKTLRKLLLGVWIGLAALEVYKQLVFSLDVTDGVASWSYQWYAFPFQFCSSPLYVLPFAIFPKSDRIRSAAMSFLATFSLFGGLAVMAYPGDVFISMVGINIQTMVHHGSQVVVGVLMMAWDRRRMDKVFFAKGVIVFAILAAVAMILNLGVHAALVSAGMGDLTFNMFFISPYHPCTLPVLSLIYPVVPYPVFLLLYLVGFSAVAWILFLLGKGILHLIDLRGRCRQGQTDKA